ncbi:MAG TPA: chromosome partitioning protein ParB, partial [Verrucomicrobiae bacterium]|nr:chromosome partitioning protein ParB [Verrucomicrobiae bacterium]
MNDRPDSAPAPEWSRAEIELSQLDLRYEGHRLRQRGLEDRLLASIAREGIREPLAGVVVDSVCVLLDGFKRYRCAHQLHVERVPFVRLGADEASAIVELLGQGRRSRLSVLEEARFLDELKARGMSLAEMAEALGRSKAWVSLRLGLLEAMSPVVRQHVFGGGLPVYSWIYTIAPFRRLNGVTVGQVEEFVGAVSGRGLSVRQIEQLTQGYFRGPESFRQELRSGHLTLLLQQMAVVPVDPEGCSEFERILVGDLELIQ